MEVRGLRKEVYVSLSLVQQAQVGERVNIEDQVSVVARLGMQVEGDELIKTEARGRIPLLCDGFDS